MKNNTATSLLFFLFFVACNYIQAQTKSRLPCINKKLSIVVHVVQDSTTINKYGLFAPAVPATFIPQIQLTIDSLNAHFAPVCISFEVCEYRYIENYWYLKPSPTSTTQKQFDEMQVLYNAQDRVNIYYVKAFDSPYSYFVDGRIDTQNDVNQGGILLNSLDKKSLLQAMGIYFGLIPTPGNGGELVNGSNSTTAGDLIKDTPADPNGNVDVFTCQYTGAQKDAMGNYYTPITGNAMSPYPFCLCNSPYAFTHDQYVKMTNTYLSNPVAW